MNKFICVVGISGSGKSTYAAKLSQETGYPVVSTDALRKEYAGSESNFDKDEEVWGKRVKQHLYRALAAGSVIFDATGVTKKSRKRVFTLATEGGARIECHYFNPDLERAKKQNQFRPRKVPDIIIEEQAKAWQTPAKDEGFDLIVNIDHNEQSSQSSTQTN